MESEDESAAPSSSSFGRYQTFRVLGEGATATVYLAKDPHLSRRVAIKVIKPQLLQSEAMLARFRTEASILANLRHPNILQVHDYDVDGEAHFLVMEYVEGPGFQSLLDALEGRPMPQETAAYLVHQAALGLAAAHRQGLVHRDIKPDNMLIAADGALKIADFGIAHIADLNLTQAGDLLGTPYYMAPEQTLAETPVPQTDLWAMGVVLYYCLAGRRPFEGTSFPEIKRRIRLGSYVPLREAAPGVDESLASLVETLLSADPQRRGTAQSLAQDLKAFLDGTGIADWDAHVRDFLAAVGIASLDRTTVEFQSAMATPAISNGSRWKGSSTRGIKESFRDGAKSGSRGKPEESDGPDETGQEAAQPAQPVQAQPYAGFTFKRMAMAWVFPIVMFVGVNVFVRWNIKQTTAAATAQVNGILEIRSAPPGAGIQLDGDELGLTPLTQILKTGRYRVKLTHSAFPGQVKDTTVTLNQGITKVEFRFQR